MSTVLGVLAIVFGGAYFLPTIVAVCRDVPSKFWIFILNLFFGFSVLGWWLAYMYALGPSKDALRQAHEREQLAIDADRAVIEMERRTRADLALRSSRRS